MRDASTSSSDTYDEFTYERNLIIPPIVPALKDRSPIPNCTTKILLRYDSDNGLPLYRVRITPLVVEPPALDDADSLQIEAELGLHSEEAEQPAEEGRIVVVSFSAILDYVSPAELERFENEQFRIDMAAAAAAEEAHRLEQERLDAIREEALRTGIIRRRGRKKKVSSLHPSRTGSAVVTETEDSGDLDTDDLDGETLVVPRPLSSQGPRRVFAGIVLPSSQRGGKLDKGIAALESKLSTYEPRPRRPASVAALENDTGVVEGLNQEQAPVGYVSQWPKLVSHSARKPTPESTRETSSRDKRPIPSASRSPDIVAVRNKSDSQHRRKRRRLSKTPESTANSYEANHEDENGSPTPSSLSRLRAAFGMRPSMNKASIDRDHQNGMPSRRHMETPDTVRKRASASHNHTKYNGNRAVVDPLVPFRVSDSKSAQKLDLRTDSDSDMVLAISDSDEENHTRSKDPTGTRAGNTGASENSFEGEEEDGQLILRNIEEAGEGIDDNSADETEEDWEFPIEADTLDEQGRPRSYVQASPPGYALGSNGQFFGESDQKGQHRALPRSGQDTKSNKEPSHQPAIERRISISTSDGDQDSSEEESDLEAEDQRPDSDPASEQELLGPAKKKQYLRAAAETDDEMESAEESDIESEQEQGREVSPDYDQGIELSKGGSMSRPLPKKEASIGLNQAAKRPKQPLPSQGKDTIDNEDGLILDRIQFHKGKGQDKLYFVRYTTRKGEKGFRSVTENYLRRIAPSLLDAYIRLTGSR